MILLIKVKKINKSKCYIDCIMEQVSFLPYYLVCDLYRNYLKERNNEKKADSENSVNNLIVKLKRLNLNTF